MSAHDGQLSVCARAGGKCSVSLKVTPEGCGVQTGQACSREPDVEAFEDVPTLFFTCPLAPLLSA